jgi:thiopeptide-type bacteriocin biosynthesis protein
LTRHAEAEEHHDAGLLDGAAGLTLALHTAVVTGLGPELERLQDAGVIAGWWFIRKAPCWRLRMKPGYDVECADMKTSANSILDGLTTAGVISRWRRTLYGPETVAFGGRPGMDIAHDLFCSDSSNILAYLRRPEPTIGRRELSVLLCGALFRAAGQAWFECGDIWHRVARLRPIPAEPPPTGSQSSRKAFARYWPTMLAPPACCSAWTARWPSPRPSSVDH